MFSSKNQTSEQKTNESANESEDKQEMTTTQRVQAAYEMIKRVQRKPELQFMANDSVPLDLEGTMVLPEIPERKYVTEYLDLKHIDRDLLQTHLYAILQDFMVALNAQDYDKMGQIAESRFVNKLKDQKAKYDSPEWIKFEKVEHDPTRVVTVDKLFIKGVGMARSTNDD